MKLDKILITGAKGYLGKHIIDSYLFQDFEFIIFNGDVRDIKNWEKYNQEYIKYIFHAGSPAANLNEYSEKYIKESIIKGTKNAIELSKTTQSTLVNFSTRGIYNCTNIYEDSKKIAYIETLNNCNNIINLIIPRVYSSDRKKGLIPKLQSIPEKDLERNIQYITIEHFLNRLRNGIEKNKDHVLFFPFRENTIKELMEIF